MAVDEWSIIPDQYTDKIVGNDPAAPYRFNLRDALWVAGGMNALLRSCGSIRLYDPLKLYATRTKKVVLDVLAKCDQFETRGFGLQPFLDVFGSYVG